MEVKNFKFVSDTDGLEIDAMAIIPDGQIKALVQIAHGMCEYKERYIDFMNFLAGKGYVCVISDHRGHGKSIKSDNDLGYMYEGGAEGLVEDLHKLMKTTKDKFGTELPYYLLGHSMGSLIVRCFAKKYDGEIDKLAVVGSPSDKPGKSLGLFFARIIEKIRGERGKTDFLTSLTVEGYEKPFKDENIRHAWVNSDRAAVEAYNNDPLCNYTFTNNGYKNLISITTDTYDLKNWKMENPDMPIYFFSGAQDPCAAGKKSFEKSADFMRRVGYKNVRTKMYENMRHEILNEPDHMQVYEDIETFFNEGR